MTAIRIAARMRRIKPSPSSAASDRLAELRRDGRNALSVTVEPGDEVLVPAPYWVSYPTWCWPATARR